MNAPLRPDDPRLPAVRARLYTLLRLAVERDLLTVGIGRGASLHAWPFLDLAWQMIQVEHLVRRLLDEILPRLEHDLHATTQWETRSSPTPRAPIDWQRFWRHQKRFPRSSEAPHRHLERSFDLPENRLVWMALTWAERLTRSVMRPLADVGVPDAARLLHRLEALRQRPPWCWFPPTPMQVTSHDRARLEAVVARHAGYAALWRWWREVEHHVLPHEGRASTMLPADEPDRLYELLVLLSLVVALAEHGVVRQLHPLFDAHPRHGATFLVETRRGPLYIYYQKSTPLQVYRRLPNLRGLPDIILAWGEPLRLFLLDAKNYAARRHGEALYKMLGYFYNFGYPDHFERLIGGALIFSTEEREGMGMRAWHEGEGQRLFSFVVPPLPDERYRGMEEFIAWLLEAIHRLRMG